MKIAITGHTKGIGKACYELLSQEHEVLGFSRSNGFDINDPEPIFSSSKNCDVFINNAYCDTAQSTLFDMFFQAWEHSDKTIVNIVSKTMYLTKMRLLSVPSPGSLIYAGDKKHLEHVVDTHVFANQFKICRVININPGYVNTDMMPNSAKQVGYDSLSSEKLAEVIKWTLDQPQDVEIYDLSIWKTSVKKQDL